MRSAERHRLDLVVGDVDHRRLQPRVQRRELGAGRDAQLGIEVRQRLVEQEGGRVAHDRAADGDALALAARELAGPAVEQAADLQHARGLGDARLDLGARHPGVLQPEGEVLAHAHVRVERVGLEHHRQPAIGRRHGVDQPAVDADLAAGRPVEPGDLPQQRGLAAARRADEDHQLAVDDVEVDVLQHVHRAVGLAEVGQRDPCSCVRLYFRPAPAMPVVMKRCRKTKTSTTGIIVTTVMARMKCHCTLSSPE